MSLPLHVRRGYRLLRSAHTACEDRKPPRVRAAGGRAGGRASERVGGRAGRAGGRTDGLYLSTINVDG